MSAAARVAAGVGAAPSQGLPGGGDVRSPSRLRARLDAAIAAARDPMQRDCLRAERAALLARSGRAADAASELAALREGGARHPALAVWLCLAEGVAAPVHGDDGVARDRLQRAYALAVAARLRPLIALGAAWLADAAERSGDVAALTRHLVESLQEAAADDHAARARAGLVAARAYHAAGRADRAQAWYRRAHGHATAEGDDATLGALLLARACATAGQVRLAGLLGAAQAPGMSVPRDPDAVRHALMSLDSAEHFQAHAGHGHAPARARRARALLLAVQEAWAEALPALGAELEAPGADLLRGVERATLRAERARGRCRQGDAAGALDDARAAEAALGPAPDAHDAAADATGDEALARAAAHARLHQVGAALGHEADAVRHAQSMQAACDRGRRQQADTVAALDGALRQVGEVTRLVARA